MLGFFIELHDDIINEVVLIIAQNWDAEYQLQNFKHWWDQHVFVRIWGNKVFPGKEIQLLYTHLFN